MKVEWDFKELFDFGDNLRSFGSAFDTHAQAATKRLAEALLADIKKFTPIGKTGKLIKGWEGNDFLVTPLKNGYQVKIVNTTAYAKAVNDGHKSYNQFGGPYEVNDKKRIKVPSPHQWQEGSPISQYVYGHFFVERGILQFSESSEIEQIIMRELQKWWDSL